MPGTSPWRAHPAHREVLGGVPSLAQLDASDTLLPAVVPAMSTHRQGPGSLGLDSCVGDPLAWYNAASAGCHAHQPRTQQDNRDPEPGAWPTQRLLCRPRRRSVVLDDSKQ